jgi:hypothetical protein
MSNTRTPDISRYRGPQGPKGLGGVPGSPGAAGPPGVDGSGAQTSVLSTSISDGAALTPNPADVGTIRSVTDPKTRRRVGVATGNATPGTSQAYQLGGLVPSARRTLGPGTSGAVGVDVNGVLVRASDPTCVSALNFDGWCDTAGNIISSPSLVYVFNARDFGAVGDGHIVGGVVVGTDDTDAIQACIAAAKRYATANVGLGNPQPTIYFPHGVYLTSQSLDFRTTGYYANYFPGVTICGDGGALGTEEPASSAIVYTGSSGRLIDARSTIGFTARDIALLYNDRTYADTLIDFAHSEVNNDTQTATLINCSIGFAYSPSSGLGRANKLVSLDRALFSVIDNCYLSDGRIGIWGTADGYSNQVTIHKCTFSSFDFAAIADIGDAWNILGCAFEGPFLSRLIGDTRTGAHVSGMVVDGCWTGDCGNWAPWIDCGNSEFHSTSIRGNLFSASIANPAASYTGTVTFDAAARTIALVSGTWASHGFDANVQFDVTGTASNDGQYMCSLPPVGGVMQVLQATLTDETVSCTLANSYPVGSTKDSVRLGGSKGIDITANNLNTVDFTPGYGPSNAAGIHIHGNELQAEDTAGAPLFRGLWENGSDVFADVVIHANSSKYQNTPGQDWISGHIVTVPAATVKPTATSATGSSVALDGNVYTGSNDTAGRITLTVSAPTAPGEQVRVTFARAYNYVAFANPYVQITPGNAATADLAGIWASADGTSGVYFLIGSTGAIPPGVYVWQYWVTQ